MKSKRQEKILELIAKYDIETQEELIAHLAECGIESKQTTVSRDIKELYLYKEFQRLKEEEQKQLGWSAKRELAKLNYRIHTDAIKQNLIPPELDRRKASIVYANEADVLNVAMFGMTAQEWREANPDKKGNIRDYANINELICLSNLESLNAVFINDGIPQGERLLKLNRVAISQMKVLTEVTDRQIFLPEAPPDGK